MKKLLTMACFAAAFAMPGAALAASSPPDHSDSGGHSGGGEHSSGGGGGEHGGGGGGGGHSGGGGGVDHSGGGGHVAGGDRGGGSHVGGDHAGGVHPGAGSNPAVAHGGPRSELNAGSRGGLRAGGPRSRGAGPGQQGGVHPTSRITPGPVSRLGVQAQSRWRGGHWRHGRFGGRMGWWWWAGGIGYCYDEAVYPYPDYVADIYVQEESSGHWYYCDDPAGMYPQVKRCRTAWRAVAAPPSDAPRNAQDSQDEGVPPPDDAIPAPE